jgi:hypothetical protein
MHGQEVGQAPALARPMVECMRCAGHMGRAGWPPQQPAPKCGVWAAMRERQGRRDASPILSTPVSMSPGGPLRAPRGEGWWVRPRGILWGRVTHRHIHLPWQAIAAARQKGGLGTTLVCSPPGFPSTCMQVSTRMQRVRLAICQLICYEFPVGVLMKCGAIALSALQFPLCLVVP